MTKARIYRPAKTAMQSGTAQTRGWRLEFVPEGGKRIDPLMGWTGSVDTQRQVRLHFDTREDAEAYATRMGLIYDIRTPKTRQRILKAYADNFK